MRRSLSIVLTSAVLAAFAGFAPVSFAGDPPAAPAAPAVDAAAKGTVTGVVKDKDGKVVAGVTVELVAQRAKGKKNAVGFAPEFVIAKPKAPGANAGAKPAVQPVAQAVTDAEGKFTLEAPAGEYMVVIRDKVQGAARTRATITAGQPVAITLTLEVKAPKAPKVK